ncbi:MAG: exonuclease VII small subunit [Arcobacter butzleri]|jgi:exodeoxyribonuclease VII small subunit|nr:exodeoxyribonuclease VII small subunit [Arcobacteraceae bacterium]MDY0364312.1 exodeoxyribonuclease VII small subunit [Arcobacteraceae bacterium]NLO16772.1 exonuclease VII small subunit [Aliarcobacter butzleri]
MSQESVSFEQKIEKAKVLLQELTNPELPLTKGVEIYKMGLKELQEASNMLEKAKLEFEVLSKPSNI